MEPLLHSFAYSLDYLREMIADVPDDLMRVQPNGIANHPAWTVGHLVFIAQAIGGVIGIDPWLSDDWEKQFGPGSNPSDSAAQAETLAVASVPLSAQAHASARAISGLDCVSVLHTKAALISALDTAQAELTIAVSALTDAQLDEPFPDPSYADVFPTVRHALTQVLLGHTAFHIGQISVWRRAMNLPRISRSYE